MAFSGTFDGNGYPIDPDTNKGDTGWHICDGTNGTPDLRGKFILGASDSHVVGSTGGEENHQLTVEELAVHSHTVYTDDNFCAVLTGNNNKWKQGLINVNQSFTDGHFGHYCGAVGNNAAHNNMPPYYTLSYIMKI